MNEQQASTPAELVLPEMVVKKIDLAKLINEMEQVDSALTTAEMRAKSGMPAGQEITVSTSLNDFASKNALNWKDGRARKDVIMRLRRIKQQAPVIHLTFAADADAESLRQIVLWLRSSIDPHTVITVGVQPNLIAGVYMRTPNHVYDLSLRSKLRGGHKVLVDALGGNRAS